VQCYEVYDVFILPTRDREKRGWHPLMMQLNLILPQMRIRITFLTGNMCEVKPTKCYYAVCYAFFPLSRLKSFLGLPTSATFASYVEIDESVAICALTIEGDIIDTAQRSHASLSTNVDDDDDEEDVSVPMLRVKLEDAMNALDTLRLFLAQQDSLNVDMAHLDQLSLSLCSSMSSRLKQSKITDYFK
jgi:hypothetical protein